MPDPGRLRVADRRSFAVEALFHPRHYLAISGNPQMCFGGLNRRGSDRLEGGRRLYDSGIVGVPAGPALGEYHSFVEYPGGDLVPEQRKLGLRDRHA